MLLFFVVVFVVQVVIVLQGILKSVLNVYECASLNV